MSISVPKPCIFPLAFILSQTVYISFTVIALQLVTLGLIVTSVLFPLPYNTSSDAEPSYPLLFFTDLLLLDSNFPTQNPVISSPTPPNLVSAVNAGCTT